jgi:hypothetical protein
MHLSPHPIPRGRVGPSAPRSTLAFSALDILAVPLCFFPNSNDYHWRPNHRCRSIAAQLHANYCLQWGPVANNNSAYN